MRCNKNETESYAEEIIALMMSMRNEAQRSVLMHFFKTGKGQYGEGDEFLGLKVPQTRAIVREALDLTLADIDVLLASPYHEIRLCGFLVLVEQMKKLLPKMRSMPKGECQCAKSMAQAKMRDEIVTFYLAHADRANNWDLVDLSCPGIVGEWLHCPNVEGIFPDRSLLDALAQSTNLWEQRIGIVSTLRLIRADEFADSLRISKMLLGHKHDLIHKAVGWMLREVGKHDVDVLRGFLESNVTAMPRTTLRYAIERLAEPERQQWLKRR